MQSTSGRSDPATEGAFLQYLFLRKDSIQSYFFFRELLCEEGFELAGPTAGHWVAGAKPLFRAGRSPDIHHTSQPFVLQIYLELCRIRAFCSISGCCVIYKSIRGGVGRKTFLQRGKGLIVNFQTLQRRLNRI